MATVYSAHVESGERAGSSIALKVVNRELTRDPMVLRRFHREAKAASRLKHPNTVEVYEYGVDGDDAFIAMELAAGTDLLQALAAENPMRQARAALVVSQICAALSAAHAQGIIHRDLKPENVMLIPDPSVPGGERVKVLDFGIAKIVETPKPGSGTSEDEQPSYVTKTALTRVGTIVGTPAYMSPEQCRGGELDGRSDVYSCGVLLYQILTGEVPFTGETPLHTAMRHIHAQPKPPRELRPSLAPALEKVVLKALAKWPGERHQTADQLREELLALVPALPDVQDGDIPEVDPNAAVADEQATGATDATELLIEADPRMENGALGAGKLGSVRLLSLAAAQSRGNSPPPPQAADGARSNAKSDASQPPADGQRTNERKVAPTPPIPPKAEASRPRSAAPPPKPAGANDTRTDKIRPEGWGRNGGAAPPRDQEVTGEMQTGRRTTLRGGYGQKGAASDERSPTGSGPAAKDNAEEPRTLQKQQARDGAPPAPPAGDRRQPQVATQPLAQHDAAKAKGGPRQARPTETGLTPTAQIPRDRVDAMEQGAAQARAPHAADDDDEPQTFVRNPPASQGFPTDPTPGTPFNEPSYSEEKRPFNNTLVMDESQARQMSPPAHHAPPQAAPPQAAPSPAPRGPAPSPAPRGAPLPRTIDSPVDNGQRAMIDAAYDDGLARERKVKEIPVVTAPTLQGSAGPVDHAALVTPAQRLPTGPFAPGNAATLQSGMPVGATRPSAQHPMARSPQGSSAASIPLAIAPGPARTINDEPSRDLAAYAPLPADLTGPFMIRPDPQFGAVKSTVRMSPEAAQQAAAMYPVGLRRTQSPAPGLRGKLEEFSGAALLLIGIAVGLFLALIGLVIVIVLK